MSGRASARDAACDRGPLGRSAAGPRGRIADAAKLRTKIFNDFMRPWGHLHVYDEEDPAAKMRQAGFTQVIRCEPGTSEHEALRGLEHHGQPWQNDAEAMCLEGTKRGEGQN